MAAFFFFFCHSVGLNSDDREHRACKTQIFTIWLFLEKEFGRLWSPGQDGKKLEELMRASWRCLYEFRFLIQAEGDNGRF